MRNHTSSGQQDDMSSLTSAEYPRLRRSDRRRPHMLQMAQLAENLETASNNSLVLDVAHTTNPQKGTTSRNTQGRSIVKSRESTSLVAATNSGCKPEWLADCNDIYSMENGMVCNDTSAVAAVIAEPCGERPGEAKPKSRKMKQTKKSGNLAFRDESRQPRNAISLEKKQSADKATREPVDPPHSPTIDWWMPAINGIVLSSGEKQPTTSKRQSQENDDIDLPSNSIEDGHTDDSDSDDTSTQTSTQISTLVSTQVNEMEVTTMLWNMLPNSHSTELLSLDKEFSKMFQMGAPDKQESPTSNDKGALNTKSSQSVESESDTFMIFQHYIPAIHPGRASARSKRPTKQKALVDEQSDEDDDEDDNEVDRELAPAPPLTSSRSEGQPSALKKTTSQKPSHGVSSTKGSSRRGKLTVNSKSSGGSKNTRRESSTMITRRQSFPGLKKTMSNSEAKDRASTMKKIIPSRGVMKNSSNTEKKSRISSPGLKKCKSEDGYTKRLSHQELKNSKSTETRVSPANGKGSIIRSKKAGKSTPARKNASCNKSRHPLPKKNRVGMSSSRVIQKRKFQSKEKRVTRESDNGSDADETKIRIPDVLPRSSSSKQRGYAGSNEIYQPSQNEDASTSSMAPNAPIEKKEEEVETPRVRNRLVSPTDSITKHSDSSEDNKPRQLLENDGSSRTKLVRFVEEKKQENYDDATKTTDGTDASSFSNLSKSSFVLFEEAGNVLQCGEDSISDIQVARKDNKASAKRGETCMLPFELFQDQASVVHIDGVSMSSHSEQLSLAARSQGLHQKQLGNMFRFRKTSLKGPQEGKFPFSFDRSCMSGESQTTQFESIRLLAEMEENESLLWSQLDFVMVPEDKQGSHGVNSCGDHALVSSQGCTCDEMKGSMMKMVKRNGHQCDQQNSCDMNHSDGSAFSLQPMGTFPLWCDETD